MMWRFRGLCSLFILCASILCTSGAKCFSLDREAFTPTNYDLNVRIEPAQQRLGVRGKITLRNDTQTAQKIAVLQISSSHAWRSIPAGPQAVQFVTQTYTSDVDHTGALSEAIVTLPSAIAPKGTVELEIAYEGVIALDASRLIRIGTPEATAKGTDWDQIGENFTAVRGAGYVAWYPIATEAADLDEGGDLFDVLARWNSREAATGMHVQFRVLQMQVMKDAAEKAPGHLVSNALCLSSSDPADAQYLSADCSYKPLGQAVPTFVIADYQVVNREAVEVHYLPTHEVSATNYADAAEKVAPLVSEWFGKQHERARTADLPGTNTAPFESGSLLLTPLTVADPKLAGLVAAHQLAHAAFHSLRLWIDEGAAHFAQALYLEQQKGRQTALDYMGLHRSAFNEAEKKSTPPKAEDEASRSLVNTTNDELYRSKAMYVWWMLRDMIGESALKKALAAYRPEQDKEPSYMPKLIQAQTQRDLEWFFDDWVYRDRGLPNFKVESAFVRKTMKDAYMLTITVENLGAAGAEVPLTVKFVGGETGRRLEVRAKSKNVIRVETSAAPVEIVVNDGSVPESDLANNTYKIDVDKIETGQDAK